jgi:hypothetical protein
MRKYHNNVAMKEEQEQALQAFGGGNSEYKGTS